jgi:hypothetical protein
MSVSGSGTVPQVPKYTLLNYLAADVIQNDWYTAVQLYDVEFTALAMGVVTNNETLEMRITIDGVVWAIAAGIAVTAGQFSPVTALNIAGMPTVTFTCAATTATVPITQIVANYIPWLRGRSIKIEVRKTTATAGTSDLRVIGQYGKY